MSYRDRPKARPETASPPVRWWDHLRYWVRLVVRAMPHWLGAPLALFVWLTSMSPKPEFGVNQVHLLSWMFFAMWAVLWLLFCGQDVMIWAKQKDRLEE